MQLVWRSCYLLILSSSLMAFTCQAMTLSEALQETFVTNPRIKSLVANKIANQADLRVAQGGWYPSVSLAAVEGREKSKSSSTAFDTVTKNRHEKAVTVNQLLFDGFGVSSQIQQRKERIKTADYQFLEARSIIGLRVVEAYLNVVRFQKLVQLAKDNAKNHSGMLRKSEARYEGGAGRKSDNELVVARYSLARATLNNLEQNLSEAESNFLALVGRAPSKLSFPKFPNKLLPSSLQQAIATAKEQNATLGVRRSEIKVARAAVFEAKSAMYPRLTAEINAQENDNIDGVDGPNDKLAGLLRLRYDIYKGGSDVARIRERGARKVEAQEEFEFAIREITDRLTIAWHAYHLSQNRVKEFTQYVKSSNEVLDAYQKQFEIGQRALFNVLDQQNELFNARSALMNAQYEALLSAYRVIASMGLLAESVR